MPQEIAPLLRRLKGLKREKRDGFQLYRGTLNGTELMLIESGMGPQHAAAATRKLIELASPRALLNFGFGGGVLPGLAVGDLVLAERVFLLEKGELSEAPAPDTALSGLVLQACESGNLSLRRGAFITAAAIMNKEKVAAAWQGRIPHPVLEMETAAVLREGARAGIPVVAVRGISDAADEELDFSLEEFCDRELRISPLRVLACIARKPRIIPQLMRLAANSNKAGLKLAAGVELALKTLAALS